MNENFNISMFYSNADDDATNAIQDAMDAYMEQTCITFEERTNQQDYVRFYRGNGYKLSACVLYHVQNLKHVIYS